jgi:hypothetical protein
MCDTSSDTGTRSSIFNGSRNFAGIAALDAGQPIGGPLTPWRWRRCQPRSHEFGLLLKALRCNALGLGNPTRDRLRSLLHGSNLTQQIDAL